MTHAANVDTWARLKAYARRHGLVVGDLASRLLDEAIERLEKRDKRKGSA